MVLFPMVPSAQRQTPIIAWFFTHPSVRFTMVNASDAQVSGFHGCIVSANTARQTADEFQVALVALAGMALT